MKMIVTKYPEKIEFEVIKVTQLCGQNIRRKQFVINSLAKYFSNEKYMENDEQYRDNVLIDDEQVGRNYFKVIRISGIDDIIALIKLGKSTLLSQYIKTKLDNFECANQLAYIEDKLSEIFNIINDEMADSIGNIALDFKTSDLWEMVQKSKVYSINGEVIERKSPIELLEIMMNLIAQNANGERVMIIIENIDHLLDVCEYKLFMNEMNGYGDIYNIYTLVTTSLDGYIIVNQDVMEGITVFNEVDFSFPNVERLRAFINDNYPYYRQFKHDEIMNHIEKMVQKIGKEGYMIENDTMTICKLINDTLIIPEIRKSKENRAVTAFLNGCSVV